MLGLVVAIGAALFLAIILIKILDPEKHFLLQMILIFWVFAAMLLLPKAGIDAMTVCEPVINQTVTTGATTTYTYSSHCHTSTAGTGLSFLQITQRLFYIFIGYTIVYLGIWAMLKLYEKVGGKPKGIIKKIGGIFK